jgi:hypothetical protein
MRNPLVQDAINRNIEVLKSPNADPDGAEFRRAKAIVEAYRHEEVMSMHEEAVCLARTLIRLTWGLLILTLALAVLTGVLAWLAWRADRPCGEVARRAEPISVLLADPENLPVFLAS